MRSFGIAGTARVAATLCIVALAASACGSSAGDDTFPNGAGDGNGNGDGNGGGGTFGGDGGTGGEGSTGGCTGLQCQIDSCSGGTKTTLSGKVYAPNGVDPLYNAILYVPNAALSPFTEGVSCDKCGAITSGSPIATALSASDGTFRLEDVPTGDNIPLVIQIGRWRRQVTIPHVDSCKETPLTVEQTRLPRNKTEGDIPLMAIATSQYDPTECIMRKIGIDDSEFTIPSGAGRVHIYRGGGATLSGSNPPPASDLWKTPENLKRYDIVAFPCQTDPSAIPNSSGRTNAQTYANAGGRVFVTDLSQDLIKSGPAPWPSTANWSGSGQYNPSIGASIDTSFPKGEALAEWLQATGSTTTKGQLTLTDTYDRFKSATAPSQRWVYTKSDTQTYSFNTPVGTDADSQCGRVVYSSFHIAEPDSDNLVFPQHCTSGALTAQEKTLEFLLFDLAACIQKDDAPPTPPPVVK